MSFEVDPEFGAAITPGGRGSVPVAASVRHRPSHRPALSEWAIFWRRAPIQRIAFGVVMLLIVMCYGVSGYMLMGWTFMDAFYQVFITTSAVGLTEVHPLNTTPLRIHTMIVIALGLFSVAYAIGGFISLLTEGEFQKYLGHQRMMKQIEALDGHLVVVGFGRFGKLVCEGLVGTSLPFVIIEQQAARISEVKQHGFLYVQGDGTEETVLRDAGIERASILVTSLANDAANVFITLTVRDLRPNLTIIARAEQPNTEKKLRQAGANHVVTPAAIGARRVVSLLTNPTVVDFIELVTNRSSVAIEVSDVPIVAGGPLAGQTLRAANIGRLTGAIVVAVKSAEGTVEFPPSGDHLLMAGDVIVLLGRKANLEQFHTTFKAKKD